MLGVAEKSQGALLNIESRVAISVPEFRPSPSKVEATRAGSQLPALFAMSPSSVEEGCMALAADHACAVLINVQEAYLMHDLKAILETLVGHGRVAKSA
jgi:hypothetical protein